MNTAADSYIEGIITRFAEAVLDPILFVLAALALLFFLWGLAQYIWKSDSEEGRKVGVRHMLWGLAGLVIIVSAWGIVNLIQSTVQTLGR